MRKILAIILVALMALSFVPFRNTKTVEAASNIKATYILMALQQAEVIIDLGAASPYPYDTGKLRPVDPVASSVYEALRPFEFKFPKLWYTEVDNEVDIFATDVYFDITSEGSLSKVSARYYVLLVETEAGVEQYNVYIDPDTVFDDPATTNNTQLLGKLDTTVVPWTFTYNLKATLNPKPYYGGGYPLKYGAAAGRFFNIGFSDRKKDRDLNEYGNTDFDGDLILFFEDLVASCCGHNVVYDVSVESDVEPAWWLPSGATPLNPKATAILSPGTGNDFTSKRGDLGRSTVPTVQVVTFMNIQLFASEYLDLEVFLDNGVDNNSDGDVGELLTADNNSDDYVPLDKGEEFIGAVNNDGLTPTSSNQAVFKFYDSLSGNIVYFFDQDNSNTLSVDDWYLEPAIAGWYKKIGSASAGDINLGLAYPSDLDVVYGNSTGTITLQGVNFVGPMNTWAIQNPVYGLTMAFGDFKGIDINVLPGEMDLDVKIETETGVEVDELKVEQTFNVTV